MAQYQITLDSSILHQLFLGGAGDSKIKLSIAVEN